VLKSLYDDMYIRELCGREIEKQNAPHTMQRCQKFFVNNPLLSGGVVAVGITATVVALVG
jgi:hypothetical protein